ncbi:MAG TPA: FAD-linked oxidase C-terminal domain-containing protein [Kineosporiaceae bacterium]
MVTTHPAPDRTADPAAGLAADLAADLAAQLPAGRISTDGDVLAGCRTDQENAPWGPPALLARPLSTQDVATIVRFGYQRGVPIVPRGSGTGLTGGCNAISGCIVLGLERMNRIREINVAERYAVVEPGVLNQQLRDAAAGHRLWYPPDPSSKDACSLGGNVATNAGGLCCVRYGVTKDYVLALEVVTGTGAVIRLGHRTAKRSVGPDLAALFVGSEGCLGVITEITLRLRPLPGPAATVVCGFATAAEAAAAAVALRGAGVQPEVCELMDERTVAAVEELMPLGLPAASGALLLLQVDGDAAADAARAVLDGCRATWTYRSTSAQEGEQLFTARRRAFEAVRRHGRVTTEDVCVPLAAVGPVLARIQEVGRRLGVDIATVAHAGDGNLHPMIIDDGTVAPTVLAGAFTEIIDVALQAGGTVSGEHGVGLLKRDAGMRELGDPVVELSSRLKAVFDPRWILNPGKGPFRAPAAAPAAGRSGRRRREGTP